MAARGYIRGMSTSEILDELPKLTKRDREEIRLKLAELDGDGWADADDPLTGADKALIASRVEAHERDPGASIPWEQFDAALKRRMVSEFPVGRPPGS
jgi:putative addiction module component (TIGR02574 family)